MPPVQRIITSQKGVALDFESASKDSKSQSKELYMWGQTEDDDLKDGQSLSILLSYDYSVLT